MLSLPSRCTTHDYVVVNFAMQVFSGIDDIKNQEFKTNYKKIGQVGDGNDWWVGNDQGLDYSVFERDGERVVRALVVGGLVA
jgi:hypothetical protein